MPPQNPYGGGEPQNTSGNIFGILSLVFGILSIVICCLYGVGILSGIGAIILGIQGKKKADAGLANNRTLANVGFILGIVGAVISLIYLILEIAVLKGGINPQQFQNS